MATKRRSTLPVASISKLDDGQWRAVVEEPSGTPRQSFVANTAKRAGSGLHRRLREAARIARNKGDLPRLAQLGRRAEALKRVRQTLE